MFRLKFQTKPLKLHPQLDKITVNVTELKSIPRSTKLADQIVKLFPYTIIVPRSTKKNDAPKKKTEKKKIVKKFRMMQALRKLKQKGEFIQYYSCTD